MVDARTAREAVEGVYRAEHARIFAGLVRTLRDFDPGYVMRLILMHKMGLSNASHIHLYELRTYGGILVGYFFPTSLT